MAVEKGKVLAALDIKFKGKSLTKNFKDSLATKWAAKIENDEGIDAYIEDREDVVLEASTEADRRATAATKKAKEDAAALVVGNEPAKKDEPVIDPNMPEWMKPFMQQQKDLLDKVNGLEASRTQESIADRFKKDDRLKGVPAFAMKGWIPTKDEDYEAAVTGLEAEYKTFAETNKLTDFGKDAPAGNAGASGNTKTDGKVDPAVVAFAQQKNKEATKQVEPAKV